MPGVDLGPLIEALQNHLQVTLNYQKKTTGELVSHTGGIYEIGTDNKGQGILFLWDTVQNDHIRKFLLDNILNYQILDTPFVDVFGWGFKLNDQSIF